MAKQVIFADLDGTFLDDQYGFSQTRVIADEVTGLGGSVVFCSSKTRHEIEFYREATGNKEPFIAENGAAIFIPKNYFKVPFDSKATSKYHVIRLGSPYRALRSKLARIKRLTSAKIIGFGDMTLEELAFETGLPLNLAKLAKKREHGEPFRIIEGNRLHVFSAIKNEGLQCVRGGRYLHLTGATDKGKAALILKNLYLEMFGRIETYGVGDGPNDYSMLKVVDNPFFIDKTQFNARLNAWVAILSCIKSAVRADKQRKV